MDYVAKWLLVKVPVSSKYFSLSVLRIAVAASFLISSLYRYDFKHLLETSIAAYEPKGIAAIIFPTPPGLDEFIGLQMGGYFFGLLSMIGIYTRITTVLHFFVNLMLASLYISFVPSSVHEYNVMLLVQSILILSPCATRLAVQKEKENDPYVSLIAAWAIQFLVGWMYFNAFLSGVKLAPTFSVFFNILCQIAVVVGSLFFQRPYLRLVSATFFLIQGLLLVHIDANGTDQIHWHWLLLVFAFVDWDFFSKARKEALNKMEFDVLSYCILAIVCIEFLISILSLKAPTTISYPFASSTPTPKCFLLEKG